MTTRENFYELYISAEEEVTTIISRVHAVKERYVVLIIPKNALLLQSTINLRLLSKESKKYQKEIVIVTQDEFGLRLAERLGIYTETLTTWQKEMSGSDEINEGSFQIEKNDTKQRKEIISNNKKNIGSNEYYRTEEKGNKNSVKNFSDIQINQLNTDNKEDKFAKEASTKKDGLVQEFDLNSQEKDEIKKEFKHNSKEKENLSNRDIYEKEMAKQSFFKSEYEEREGGKYTEDNAKSKKIFNKITKKADNNVNKKKPKTKIKIKSSFKKIIFLGIFILISVLFITTFPYSKVYIEVSDLTVSDNVTITAAVDENKADFDRRIITARKIEKDITKKVSVLPTGNSDTRPQKAKGVITIYNEFSSKPQPLVKTTRFLSKEGILFRLPKNIVVPGIEIKEGKKVPGKIEVLIVADKTGKSSNIGATNFTIPGFKGTAKEGKIYAVSESEMSGGSDGTDNYKTVTVKDIEKAKKEAEKDSEKYVIEEIEKILKPGEEILLENAVKLTLVRSESDAVLGSAVEKVSYSITNHVTAIIINKHDIEKIVEYALKQKKSNVSKDAKLEYEFKDIDPDFNLGKLVININATEKINGTVDKDEFKKEILNKTHEEVERLVKEKYPAITDISIAPTPSTPSIFADRISSRKWMTKIIEK